MAVVAKPAVLVVVDAVVKAVVALAMIATTIAAMTVVLASVIVLSVPRKTVAIVQAVSPALAAAIKRLQVIVIMMQPNATRTPHARLAPKATVVLATVVRYAKTVPCGGLTSTVARALAVSAASVKTVNHASLRASAVAVVRASSRKTVVLPNLLDAGGAVLKDVNKVASVAVVTTADPVLTAQGLRWAWPGQPALFHALSFQISAGVGWIQGDEQTGKTTLLRLLSGQWSGINSPFKDQCQGTITVVGQHIMAMAYPSPFVFWADPDDPSGSGNLQISARACLAQWQQQFPTYDPHIQAELLEGLDLIPHLDKALFMLSTGSRRKLGWVGAFAAGAPIALIDQPFAALDRASISCVMAWLEDAAAHPQRAWVIADYEAPPGLHLSWRLELPSQS